MARSTEKNKVPELQKEPEGVHAEEGARSFGHLMVAANHDTNPPFLSTITAAKWIYLDFGITDRTAVDTNSVTLGFCLFNRNIGQ